MGGGNTGAGASKHFVNVPQRDVTGKYPLINICYSDAANHYHAALRQARFMPSVKQWLKTAILSIFGNVNKDLDRKPSRHPAALVRRERQAAAERGHRTRQQAEALRRRTHRHELLAGLSKGSEAMRTPENRHQLNMFAELLAQGDTITAASGRLSISRQRGGQLLAKLRRELGWQAQ